MVNGFGIIKMEKSEENYNRGLGNGQTITYHQNGQVKSKGKYQNGKAIGN